MDTEIKRSIINFNVFLQEDITWTSWITDKLIHNFVKYE